MNRQLATWAVSGLAILLASGVRPALRAAPPDRPPGEEVKVEVDVFPKEAPGPDKPVVHGPPSIQKEIEALIAAYDLKPHPPEAFPDNPPPHEGAMIDVPHVIDTPDLIVIEVLDALPGRPITGERLVRPDGTVDLGFYGEVHVRGLTREQAKVKILIHLRKFINDDILGLSVDAMNEPDSMEEEKAEPSLVPRTNVPLPELPPDLDLFKPDTDQPPAKPPKKASESVRQSPKLRPRSVSAKRPSSFDRSRTKPTAARARTVRAILTAQQEPQAKEIPQEPQAKPGLEIPINGNAKLTITIDVQQQNAKPEQVEAVDVGPNPVRVVIDPAESDRVYVDISAYNSRYYYVQGEVAVPGRLPFTGNETVLDALNFAGGLVPTADHKNFRLVRPARGGKSAKVYPIDIDAIIEKGDPTANLQILPGDRLVIGRSALVQQTIELDRLAMPLQTVLSLIRQDTSTLKAIQELDPARRDAVMKEFLEFWSKQLSTPGDATLDEKALREALIRKLSPAPPVEKK
jgi:protein involved in polysaccharide export with SLBB domain